MGERHQEAISIEHIIRNYVGGCRGTLCGIVDADYIDIHPLVTLTVFFITLYKDSNNDNNQRKISFIIDELSCIIGNKRFDKLNVSEYGGKSEYFDLTNDKKFIDSLMKVMNETIYLINKE